LKEPTDLYIFVVFQWQWRRCVELIAWWSAGCIEDRWLNTVVWISVSWCQWRL